jgi:hypothetical protein
MTDFMLIKGNDNCWSAKEHKQKLQRILHGEKTILHASEFYMEKRRNVANLTATPYIKKLCGVKKV